MGVDMATLLENLLLSKDEIIEEKERLLDMVLKAQVQYQILELQLAKLQEKIDIVQQLQSIQS